jgi:hypothetical protein
MNIADEPVFFAPHDGRDLRVHLQFLNAVNDVHALVFELPRPLEIVFFAEARFEFDEGIIIKNIRDVIFPTITYPMFDESFSNSIVLTRLDRLRQ